MGLFTFIEKHSEKQQLIDHRNQHENHKEHYLETNHLSYDAEIQKLTFKIILITKTPKIKRYRQINYEKFPIYEGYKERKKIIKSFDKKISPESFLEKDIFKIISNINSSLEKLELDFNYEFNFQKELIQKIGYTPSWWEKTKKIWNLKNEIDSCYAKLDNKKQERKEFSQFNLNWLKETASPFWIFFIFAWVTLGLNFIFYTSNKKAEKNKKINQDKEKQYFKKLNNLTDDIRVLETKINKKELALEETENIHIEPCTFDEKGWVKLKEDWLHYFEKYEFH